MGMLGTDVNIQLTEDLCAEAVLRQHTLDSVFDDAGRKAIEHLTGSRKGRAALIAGVTEVGLVRQLLSRELDFLSIDNDDIIAGIDVRCVDGLVLAAQNLCNLCRKTTDCLILGIYNIPLAFNIGGFCHNRGFHVIPPYESKSIQYVELMQYPLMPPGLMDT